MSQPVLGHTETSSPPQLYSKQDVASHNTETDLWVIIDGRVFDLTDYLDTHPGGRKSMYLKCYSHRECALCLPVFADRIMISDIADEMNALGTSLDSPLTRFCNAAANRSFSELVLLKKTHAGSDVTKQYQKYHKPMTMTRVGEELCIGRVDSSEGKRGWRRVASALLRGSGDK